MVAEMERLIWFLMIVAVATGWVGRPSIAAAQEPGRTGSSGAPEAAAPDAEAVDEAERRAEEATVEVEIEVDELHDHDRQIVVRMSGRDGFPFDRTRRRTIRVPERRSNRIVHGRRSQDAAPDAADPSIHRPGPTPMAPFLDEEIHLKLHDGLRERIGAHYKVGEVSDLERASRRLAREVRRADGDERGELEQQLNEKLAEIFDKKMEMRRDRIERLESLLEKERSVVEERSQARDEIIDHRFDELLGEADALDW